MLRVRTRLRTTALATGEGAGQNTKLARARARALLLAVPQTHQTPISSTAQQRVARAPSLSSCHHARIRPSWGHTANTGREQQARARAQNWAWGTPWSVQPPAPAPLPVIWSGKSRAWRAAARRARARITAGRRRGANMRGQVCRAVRRPARGHGGRGACVLVFAWNTGKHLAPRARGHACAMVTSLMVIEFKETTSSEAHAIFDYPRP